MCEVLEGRESLMDLLSGDAIATLPLVACGRIRELALVDSEFGVCGGHARKIAIRMKIQSQVQHLPVEMGDQKSDYYPNLPNIEDMALIDTGLLFPYRFRTPINEKQSEKDLPEACRSGHLIGSGAIDLIDILEDFDPFDAMQGRRMHIIDAPYFTHDTDPNMPHIAREHIESVIRDTPWDVSYWDVLRPGSPATYGVLTHE